MAWSLDNKYVISASDEMCLRVWKARASEKLAMMRDRERVALDYNEKLKEKYGQHPKVISSNSILHAEESIFDRMSAEYICISEVRNMKSYCPPPCW